MQQNNPAGEASTWNELGNLYDAMGRLDDAVNAYRQATEIYFRLQDRFHEGLVRNNLADKLVKLQRYDEARAELRHAIECKQPFGHNAGIWMTWNILRDLEQAVGNVPAAAQARKRAVESYLAYRNAGGYSQSPRAQLYAETAQALRSQQTTELTEYLAQLAAQAPERWLQVVIAKLQAILGGDRDPALADDPELNYDDAAELQLLLELL
ncbi:MAG: tetratricopeptide repeat protein [Blastocatellia bacterium]